MAGLFGRGRRAPIVATVVAAGAMVGVVAAAAFAASAEDKAPGSSSTTEVESTTTASPLFVPSTARDGPPPTATSTPTPSPTPSPTPVPSPAGLRVWSNGDSTSYFMSASFLSGMVARGAVQVQPAPEYFVSSGLTSPGFFDWPAYLAAQMAAYDPHVVVFMVGANDAYADPETYRVLVGQVMDQLAGRRVAWVGQPNMGRPDLASPLPALNSVMAEEAAKRDWVVYVDTWAITSDASGAYTPYAADGTLIRGDDGVHFTSAGGVLLAAEVIKALGY